MGVAPTQKIRLSEESVAQVFRAAFSEYICLSDVSLWKRLMPDPIQQACIVLTSAANPEEASRLARTLVEERLAACASLIPGVESIYRWKGQVESATETIRGRVESGTEAARAQAETLRGQVEAGTEAARKQAEALREQLEARTEAARKQAEAIIEAARERAEAASKAARDQAESLLQVARQQAESILEAARNQAKALGVPLPDIAGLMKAGLTKDTEKALPLSEPVAGAEPVADAEPEGQGTTEAEEAPKPARRKAKKADAYDGWTKPQLQDELVRRGLAKSGNVADLRERLLADD